MEPQYYDISGLNTNNLSLQPHQLNYSELVNGFGNQMMDKFLIIGAIFLIYSYWNKCGMRRFSESGNSIPKIIMNAVCKDKAKESSEAVNDFMDGACGSVAIVSISIWLLYKIGV